MTLRKPRNVLGATAFALVASAITPSPVLAGAADSGEPSPCVAMQPTGYYCQWSPGIYYVCATGSVPAGNGVNACATPVSVVEKPPSAPAPTMPEAKPPLNIICNAPFVPTWRGTKWQCIVPKRVKLDASQ